MKRNIAVIVAYIFFLSSISWAAEEIRPLGMNSANGGLSGDIRVGNTCTTSPGGKFYCGFNTTHMLFYADNAVTVNKLYPLAAGDTGFPYVLGGTWSIDSLATYRGRLGTGTKDNTTYLRGDGTWAVPVGGGSTTTTLPWDNITSKPTTIGGYGITDYLPDNTVTAAKLSATGTPNNTSFYRGDGAWASLSGTYQPLDADLTVLSYPSNYKLFYSNGTHQITELTFGTAGECLISGGASATPGWGACGTGGSTTSLPWDNITSKPTTSVGYGITRVDNVAIDNTVIGGTTPLAGTFTTGTFSSLVRGVVSDAEFLTLDNVTTGTTIQAQLNLKSTIASPSFTGNATSTGEWTATQYNSSGSDNTHYLNVANTGPPTGPTKGDCYYDNTALQWLCWNGSSWAGAAGDVTGSSSTTFTNKTYDVSATGNVFKQVKYLNIERPVKAAGGTSTWISYDNNTTNAGQVLFSNSSNSAAGNCANYYTMVPPDLDTAVDLAVKFKFRLGGTDTGTHRYIISMQSIADSADAGGTTTTNAVNLDFPGDGAGAADDVESVPTSTSWTTLTGWKAALTPLNRLRINICREGDATQDASTVDSYTMGLYIRYGATQ
jgi:hypothetical protein